MPVSRLDAIAESAIDWMVQLRSGKMTGHQQAAMRIWLAQDVRHRQAWDRLQGLLDGAVPLRGRVDAARALLLQPRRRAVLRSLLAAMLAGGGGLLLAERNTPLRTLFADLRTATGERRRFDLPDGSYVLLNARSAADIAFEGARRLLRLRQGELLAQAVADAGRPFVVETAEGRASTRAARFCVSQQEGATQVVALEGTLDLLSAGGVRLRLEAGAMARLGRYAITRIAGTSAGFADWVDGHLSVIDASLGEVAQRLRPYRSGWLRVSPDAERLRVQGVFSLDDSDRTLRALAETLPIRLRHYGPVVVIEAAS